MRLKSNVARELSNKRGRLQCRNQNIHVEIRVFKCGQNWMKTRSGYSQGCVWPMQIGEKAPEHSVL